MPFLLLGIGLIIGVYALMRFFMRANSSQIKAFILAVFTIAVGLGLFFLAVTGKLPAAIAGLGALLPFIINYFRAKANKGEDASSANGPMTKKEALEILNLDDSASEEEIKTAYKKLMKKVHPDQEGSEWMAQKLNEAKALLLKD